MGSLHYGPVIEARQPCHADMVHSAIDIVMKSELQCFIKNNNLWAELVLNRLDCDDFVRMKPLDEICNSGWVLSPNSLIWGPARPMLSPAIGGKFFNAWKLLNGWKFLNGGKLFILILILYIYININTIS